MNPQTQAREKLKAYISTIGELNKVKNVSIKYKGQTKPIVRKEMPFIDDLNMVPGIYDNPGYIPAGMKPRFDNMPANTIIRQRMSVTVYLRPNKKSTTKNLRPYSTYILLVYALDANGRPFKYSQEQTAALEILQLCPGTQDYAGDTDTNNVPATRSSPYLSRLGARALGEKKLPPMKRKPRDLGKMHALIPTTIADHGVLLSGVHDSEKLSDLTMLPEQGRYSCMQAALIGTPFDIVQIDINDDMDTICRSLTRVVKNQLLTLVTSEGVLMYKNGFSTLPHYIRYETLTTMDNVIVQIDGSGDDDCHITTLKHIDAMTKALENRKLEQHSGTKKQRPIIELPYNIKTLGDLFDALLELQPDKDAKFTKVSAKTESLLQDFFDSSLVDSYITDSDLLFSCFDIIANGHRYSVSLSTVTVREDAAPPESHNAFKIIQRNAPIAKGFSESLANSIDELSFGKSRHCTLGYTETGMEAQSYDVHACFWYAFVYFINRIGFPIIDPIYYDGIPADIDRSLLLIRCHTKSPITCAGAYLYLIGAYYNDIRAYLDIEIVGYLNIDVHQPTTDALKEFFVGLPKAEETCPPNDGICPPALLDARNYVRSLGRVSVSGDLQRRFPPLSTVKIDKQGHHCISVPEYEQTLPYIGATVVLRNTIGLVMLTLKAAIMKLPGPMTLLEIRTDSYLFKPMEAAAKTLTLMNGAFMAKHGTNEKQTMYVSPLYQITERPSFVSMQNTKTMTPDELLSEAAKGSLKGKFIICKGAAGTGKTTLAARLAAYYETSLLVLQAAKRARNESAKFSLSKMDTYYRPVGAHPGKHQSAVQGSINTLSYLPASSLLVLDESQTIEPTLVLMFVDKVMQGHTVYATVDHRQSDGQNQDWDPVYRAADIVIDLGTECKRFKDNLGPARETMYQSIRTGTNPITAIFNAGFKMVSSVRPICYEKSTINLYLRRDLRNADILDIYTPEIGDTLTLASESKVGVRTKNNRAAEYFWLSTPKPIEGSGYYGDIIDTDYQGQGWLLLDIKYMCDHVGTLVLKRWHPRFLPTNFSCVQSVQGDTFRTGNKTVFYTDERTLMLPESLRDIYVALTRNEHINDVIVVIRHR